MSPRARILGFGTAGVLTAAGILFAALVGGSTGGAVAVALVLLGLGGALLLLFYEVGLGEDRELVRDEERRRRAERPRRPGVSRWPRRPN